MIQLRSTHLVPVIVLVGLVGNILNLIVYSRRSFTTVTPISFYFRALAMADLVSLLQFFQFYLIDMFNIDIKSHSDWMCVLLVLMVFVPPGISAWLEATISIDRLLYLIKPMRCFLLLKRRSIQTIILIVIIIQNIIIYLPLVSNYKIGNESSIDALTNSRLCKMRSESVQAAITWIDLLNFSILPFLIMLGSSFFSIRSLYNSRKSLFVNHSMSQSRRRDSKDRHFAVSSLLLNLIFIVFNLPITVINIVQIYIRNDITALVFSIALHMFFIKFALPFFVYLLVNSNFKHELIKIWHDFIK